VKWPQVTLGDALATAEVFVDGDWVESKDQDPEGDVRLIQLADVGEGTYLDKSKRFLTASKARELKCTFLKAGDVLVARMPDPLGRACIFPGDPKRAVTVVDVCLIRPNGAGPDARWLMHWFNSPTTRNQIAGFATGTTRSRISRGNLNKLNLTLPPLADQRRMVEILDKAAALRAKRRVALAQLDSLTKSIFLDMFGDPASNRKGWTRVALGEVATFVGGGTPSRENPEFFTGSICWATSKDMHSEFLDDTEEHITAEAIKSSATKLVPVGTILIVVKSKVLARRLPVAVTRVATCFGQDLKGIQVGARCEVSFVAASLRIGSALLLKNARGINTEGLTLDHLRNFPLTLPPLKLQHEFARRMESVLEIKTRAMSSSKHLDSAFASLQHRAFRGEL
jgi:type I restriction enzyme, S subunit